jgi:hypothetical protein
MTNDERDSLLKALDYLGQGDLDGAHKIAQALEGAALADTVHAIVHRREGDYSNSCYWWRRVGQGIPADLTALYGDPVAFVAVCRNDSPADAVKIADVEHRELEILRGILARSAG